MSHGRWRFRIKREGAMMRAKAFDGVILIWNNRQLCSVRLYLPHYWSQPQIIGVLRSFDKLNQHSLSPSELSYVQTCTELNGQGRSAAPRVRARRFVHGCTHVGTQGSVHSHICQGNRTGKLNGMSVFIRTKSPQCVESSERALLFDQPLYKDREAGGEALCWVSRTVEGSSQP